MTAGEAAGTAAGLRVRLEQLLWRGGPWLFGVTALGLLAYHQWTLAGARGSDFFIFRAAVARVLADPATLYGDPHGVSRTAETLVGFLYPPPSFFFLYPFGAGSVEQGFALISTGALVAAALALLIWLALLRGDGIVPRDRVPAAAALLAMLATAPILTCRLGQIDSFILLFCVAGVGLAHRQWPMAGAAILALGGWVKVYPGLLMAPLLLDPARRWRALAGFAIGAAAFAAVALLLFPLPVWRTFFVEMLPVMSERTIVNIYNQSIAANWARLWLDRIVPQSSYASVVVPVAVRAVVTIAGLAAIAAASWLAHRRGLSMLWALAISMATISLMAPLGWGHSYAYVLPLLLMVLLVTYHRRALQPLGLALICWAGLVIPPYHLFPELDAAPHMLWWLVHARFALLTMLLIGCAFALMRHSPTLATVPRAEMP